MKEEETNIKEQPAKAKPIKNFLIDKKIKVVPVQAGKKWSELLVDGDKRKDEPFMLNKVKRSYQVPLKPVEQGGGVHVILDNLVAYKTVQFPNEELTEQQFFEKMLGTDLNPLLPKEQNFFRMDKRSRVQMDKRGMTLNLANALDMLKYKILKSNKKKIAPSAELHDRRATYEFMLLDERAEIDKGARLADIKSKAAIKYAEISQSEKSMVDFFKVLGKGIPVMVDEKWLKTNIYKLVELDPELFLSYATDSFYQDKIRIHDAVQLGVLRKIKDDLYALDNGHEIGTITDVITYLNDPQNGTIKARIQSAKELAEKTNG